MQTIELLLGSIIVILTLADVFQSLVVPRPTRRSLRLAPLLLNGMWPLWKWVALRFSSPKHRAAFLGIYAPLTVIILLLSWGLALIFGYGLLFPSGRASPPAERPGNHPVLFRDIAAAPRFWRYRCHRRNHAHPGTLRWCIGTCHSERRY